MVRKGVRAAPAPAPFPGPPHFRRHRTRSKGEQDPPAKPLAWGHQRPFPAPQAPRGPGRVLTGHIECDGPLCAHRSPAEGYPTGEARPVILRAGGEQDLRGVIVLLGVQSQGSEGSPGPGDGGGRGPVTGLRQGAFEVAAGAGLQGLLDVDVGGPCSCWRGEMERPDPEGDPVCAHPDLTVGHCLPLPSEMEGQGPSFPPSLTSVPGDPSIPITFTVSWLFL